MNGSYRDGERFFRCMSRAFLFPFSCGTVAVDGYKHRLMAGRPPSSLHRRMRVHESRIQNGLRL